MTWKHTPTDSVIEIVVDPDYRGDLVALTNVRPVWIVDSPGNKERIDFVWAIGDKRNLFELRRLKFANPEDRVTNLLEVLGLLDDHYAKYDFVVHGLQRDPQTTELLESEGFRIVKDEPDGFEAKRIPSIREQLIGRA